MKNSAFGSASKSVAMIATFGATYKPTADQLVFVKKMSVERDISYDNVNWRKGCLYQVLQPLWSGGNKRNVTWGNNVAMFNGDSSNVYGHEFGHIIQGNRL
jgi:hypothetical protein